MLRARRQEAQPASGTIPGPGVRGSQPRDRGRGVYRATSACFLSRIGVDLSGPAYQARHGYEKPKLCPGAHSASLAPCPQELEEAYQDAASDVLLAVCRHSWRPVAQHLETEVLTGVFPHRSLLYVMGIMTSNGMSCSRGPRHPLPRLGHLLPAGPQGWRWGTSQRKIQTGVRQDCWPAGCTQGRASAAQQQSMCVPEERAVAPRPAAPSPCQPRCIRTHSRPAAWYPLGHVPAVSISTMAWTEAGQGEEAPGGGPGWA